MDRFRILRCLWVRHGKAWLVLPVLLPAGHVHRAAAQPGPGWPVAWGSTYYGQLGNGESRLSVFPSDGLMSDMLAIDAGGCHSIALKSDGTVWTWGRNDFGQLGDGTTTQRLVPVRVAGLDNVVAVAAGDYHTLALKADGTVWAWGRNDSGQLGDGTTTNRSTPVAVSTLVGIVAIDPGGEHSLALKSDGTVCAWGRNDRGQLGDGTTEMRLTPVVVSDLRDVTAVAAGGGHSLALKSDGSLWAWGNNELGQLGNGSGGWEEYETAPVAVSDLTDVVAVAAGAYHSLALKAGGTVWAWGNNESGQLGDGTNEDRLAPVRISSLGAVSALAAGMRHSLAVCSDGSVWAWGSNYSGQLGDGSTTNHPDPVRVSGLSGPIVLAGGSEHSLALKADGTVRAWGDNQYGQLGNGTFEGQRLRHVAVSGLSDVAAVEAGYYFSLALTNDGTIWAWGDNCSGQLGDGTTVNRTTPVQVLDLSGVVAIAAGGLHSLAVKSNGTVWAWGGNGSGQLGDGTNADRHTPVQVVGLNGVIAVAAGNGWSLALRSDGTVWAWGGNWYGQLGDGTTANRTTPVQVLDLSGVVAIAAGSFHSLALKSDGTVWAWGANWYGQLGTGTSGIFDRRTSPVRVSNLSGVVAIAAGEYHSLALKSDGTVWAWGNNLVGQLGDGTTQDRLLPVQVIGLGQVAALAAGGNHSVALRSDDTVWGWGDNWYGQLGDGTTENRSAPVQVYGLAEVTDIAAGGHHCLAVTSIRTATITVHRRTAQRGSTAVLVAGLRSINDPMPGRTLDFQLAGTPAGSAVTADNGVAVATGAVSADTPAGFYPVDVSFAGAEDLLPCFNRGWLEVTNPPRTGTILYAVDRTGTITELVTLRAYLMRATDHAWLNGKTIRFFVEGSWIGSAQTGSTGTSGRADWNWIIPEGPASRAIRARFDGDEEYLAASGTGTLTCLTWDTKMAAFDRTARITDRTELKCRLVRSDNEPIYNKTINFYVDGTFVISRPTDVNGYARYPYYDVPDGAGAGARTILSEWPGNAGYRPISKAATLTVLKAIPYIWVLPRSVPRGQTARLYAYFRRLYDYARQEGKTVSWSIDGTWIGDTVTGTTATGEPGVARFNYDTSGLSVGSHNVRCEFAGDAWVDAGHGQAELTIY